MYNYKDGDLLSVSPMYRSHIPYRIILYDSEYSGFALDYFLPIPFVVFHLDYVEGLRYSFNEESGMYEIILGNLSDEDSYRHLYIRVEMMGLHSYSYLDSRLGIERSGVFSYLHEFVRILRDNSKRQYEFDVDRFIKERNI